MSLKSADIPIQLASNSSQSLAANLAVEILFQILSPLCVQSPGPLITYRYWDVTKAKAYRRQRHDFAQISFVCQSWNQVVTTLLYREVLIFVSTIEGLRESALAFNNNAALIKSVLIDATRQPSEEHRSTIMACLKKCPNVQNLECFTHDLLFTSRTWIHALPSLASSVKTLTLHNNHHYFNVTLSRALMALGQNLERLVIYEWDASYSSGSNFHLPSAMPHLSELEFRGRPSVLEPGMAKLFSRMISKKGRSDSVLRKLSLINTSFKEEILTILRRGHVGSHLQVLHIELEHIRTVSPRLIVQIANLCPELVDFSYNGPSGIDAFIFLPTTLRSLRVCVGGISATGTPQTTFPSNSDVCEFLGSQNTLSKFGVFMKFSAFDQEHLLEAACKKKGIIFLPTIRLLI